MKTGELEKKIKASVRKHYIRKSSHDKLKKQLSALQKRLAKLEKLCGASASAPSRKKQTTTDQSAQPELAAAPESGVDDLTRIKGIGPVLQGKLHNLGIDRFTQIAAWSNEDIERISEHLDFKGRIEREEWIQQAQGLL
jgi:predicted flap endonuclease-1-like 5' DNA nuclease